MGEIAKIPLGRAMIANAIELLDRTVAEMGEKQRVHVPQGENFENSVQQLDAVGVGEDVLPQMISLPPDSRIDVPPSAPTPHELQWILAPTALAATVITL